VHGPELIVPLILAIEPDRQQAAQLTAIVRSKIGAEIVLADSAERALREVGDRIPDLILTPQLLSPRDDAAITNRLRQLGAAAAYVQTLTIPALATHQPGGAQARAKGLLSKLRRQKAAPAEAPGGCAPDVFAEQISVYLERALEARASQVIAQQPAHVEPHPAAAIEAATAILEQFANPVAEPVNVAMPALAPSEAAVHVEAEPVLQQERPAEAPLYIDVAPAVDNGGFRLQPEDERPSDSLFRPRPKATSDSSGFRLQPEEERSSDSPFRLKAEATPDQMPEPVVVAAPVPEEPIVQATPAPAVAPVVAETPRPAKAAKPVAKPAAKKKPRPATSKDDWNFFDPEETRFAALLARLDEISRHDAGGHL
jgi:hypothetical protein